MVSPPDTAPTQRASFRVVWAVIDQTCFGESAGACATPP